MVMALARMAGYPIVRINLSEQTDPSDLFGMDVPCKMPDGSQVGMVVLGISDLIKLCRMSVV